MSQSLIISASTKSRLVPNDIQISKTTIVEKIK